VDQQRSIHQSKPKMGDVRFIVERLNQRPFSRDFTLVSFDELSPLELLELFNDVLFYLDAAQHSVDLREERRQDAGATGERVAEFLRVLKYKLPQDVEWFKTAISNGEREAIYPSLHYLLSRLEPMKTRAYVAKFLKSVEVPPTFWHEESIAELRQHHKQLQIEFKETHKTLESLRHNTMKPAELKREIAQLEEEKGQLFEKISQLENKTEDIVGFQELFDATSALRKEQEEESKLLDQGREQDAAFEMSKQKLEEIRRKYENMSVSQKDDSPKELLGRLEREVRETRAYLEEKLPQELQEAHQRLSSVERGLSEPIKQQSDVDELDAKVTKGKRELESLQEQVERTRRLNGGDDKLKMFRQQSAMISGKLLQKQEELTDLRREAEITENELNEKDRVLSQMSGSSCTRDHSTKELERGVRKRSSEYEAKKTELATLRAETVILNRTEAILKGKLGENAEEIVQAIERGEIGGKRETASIADAETLQKEKNMPLDELAATVRQLKDRITKKKSKVNPQIAKLRSVREKFKEFERDFLEKRSIYENTAAGLESERMKLESDCQAFQQEAIKEESRFHHFNSLMEIVQVQLARAHDEEAFQNGEGRLLRDFRTYKDLYQHKIHQQEQLSKELRKKQKELKEAATGSTEQRQMFVDLHRLLQVKLEVQQKRSVKFSGTVGDSFLDLSEQKDVGGTNIMTIEA